MRAEIVLKVEYEDNNDIDGERRHYRVSVQLPHQSRIIFDCYLGTRPARHVVRTVIETAAQELMRELGTGIMLAPKDQNLSDLPPLMAALLERLDR